MQRFIALTEMESDEVSDRFVKKDRAGYYGDFQLPRISQLQKIKVGGELEGADIDQSEAGSLRQDIAKARLAQVRGRDMLSLPVIRCRPGILFVRKAKPRAHPQ